MFYGDPGSDKHKVLHLGDGRYAIIEIENLIRKHNEEEEQVPLRLQDLKIVFSIPSPLHKSIYLFEKVVRRTIPLTTFFGIIGANMQGETIS